MQYMQDRMKKVSKKVPQKWFRILEIVLETIFLDIHCLQSVNTECYCVVVSTLASYLEGQGLNLGPETSYHGRVLWFSFDPPDKCKSLENFLDIYEP
jgi:hypothetical protein